MTTQEKISTIATRAGAWVLTAAAMLATSEMVLHREHAAVPIEVGTGHAVQMAHSEPATSRGEAKESARLPEEYDVGLRTPTIAGE